MTRAEAEFRAVRAGRERVLLPTSQRVLGAEHATTLWIRRGLADVLARQGLYEQAETEYRAVLAGREQAPGADHPDVSETSSALKQIRKTAPNGLICEPGRSLPLKGTATPNGGSASVLSGLRSHSALRHAFD